MLVMEVMVPRQLDLLSIVGKVMLKSASSASNLSGVQPAGRFCLGGVPMPWPQPSGAGLPRNGRDHGEVCRRNSPRVRGGPDERSD
jgi:hypothetical protein